MELMNQIFTSLGWHGGEYIVKSGKEEKSLAVVICRSPATRFRRLLYNFKRVDKFLLVY